MLKRPISAPFSSGVPSGGNCVSRRGLCGVISPCHTVAMLPTNNAPTRIIANPGSKRQTTRSFRANKLGTAAAVTALTLNSLPGTNHAARSVPAIGMWMR